ncbi:MAG: hypothetical protein E7403_00975 [Ruminococcaceae bacterium]|nr:hypothetical protein [Oscillospiraceae bacterium]
MLIYYENEIGMIRFGGGNERWNITDYSGLSLAEKSFFTASYAESPGQVTIREKAEARVITLRGDYAGDGEALSLGMRVLNKKGRLTVTDGVKTRCIEAYCSHFEMNKPCGIYREFVAQFTADDPFFEGAEAIEMALYSREDLVESKFTLPCVFTRRIMTSKVYNHGDVMTEPVFTIFCNRVSDSEEAGILLKNETTGAQLRLLYVLQEGETVTVDISRRRITSDTIREDNNGGSLIFFMSEDTVLKNLYLVPGENQFSVTNFAVESDMLVTCRMKEKYLEAVM